MDDLSDEVWNSNLGISKKLDLIFELYEDMPEHYLLFNIWIECGREWDTEKYVLTKYRKCLSSKDKALARAVMYDLWCGVDRSLFASIELSISLIQILRITGA